MAVDQGYADALREIRELKEKLAAAHDALRPFAEFDSSLRLWRTRGWLGLMQEAWPNHKPVLQRTHPIDGNMERICSLFVSDFKRAADVLGATDNKEQ